MSALVPRWLFNLEQCVDRTAAVAITTFLFDAGTKRFATVFRPIPGKTISHMGIYCSTLVGAPPVFEVRLESVAAGTPSGTLLAPDARGAFTPAATAWSWVPFDAGYTPTSGAAISAVVAWSTGTIGAANSATFNFRLASAFAGANPWPTSNSGTAWTASNGTIPILGIRYSDGTIHPGIAPLRTATLATFATNSSPNEVGNRFISPAGLTIDAIGVLTRLVASGQATLRLYDDAGTQLAGIDAQPIDALKDSAATSAIGTIVAQIAPLDLSAGTRYVCAVRPTNTVGCYQCKLTFADAASRAAFFGDAWWVQRTGTGPWTEDLTSVAVISPRMSAINIPPQNVQRHPGMCGGLNG
ncbi:MAG: hypothetical protein NT069_24180 [Planctomycetota bacterium]|nr:hypothetical protein [Planctomycetota bacterium]